MCVLVLGLLALGRLKNRSHFKAVKKLHDSVPALHYRATWTLEKVSMNTGLKGQNQSAYSMGTSTSSDDEEQNQNSCTILPECLKFNIEEGYESEGSSDESDVDEETGLSILESEEFQQKMLEVLEREDAEWLLGWLKHKKEKCMKACKHESSLSSG